MMKMITMTVVKMITMITMTMGKMITMIRMIIVMMIGRPSHHQGADGRSEAFAGHTINTLEYFVIIFILMMMIIMMIIIILSIIILRESLDAVNPSEGLISSSSLKC